MRKRLARGKVRRKRLEKEKTPQGRLFYIFMLEGRKGVRRLFPLYCKQDIFIFYIQWLIFLLIGNTMKNTMLRKGLTIF